MKAFTAIVLFALSSHSLSLSAETTHHLTDPNALTRGCQNHVAAVHDNADVVVVSYHGQFLTHANGYRSQNGGVDGAGCETESIERRDLKGRTVWKIEPNDASRVSKGLNRIDRVDSLVAMPNGDTIMATREMRREGKERLTYVAVTRLDGGGNVVWRFVTERAPQFTIARLVVSANGALFVDYGYSNFGYDGGLFQLTGGRTWKTRKNSLDSLIAALDSDGNLMWEKQGAMIVDASETDVLTMKVEVKGKNQRYAIKRIAHDGKKLSSATTRWFAQEGVLSTARFDGALVVTGQRETLVREGNRVETRDSTLRFFDLSSGKEIHRRALSDGARIAARRGDAPLRIVSPTNCRRGLNDSSGCQTDGVQVLTLQSAKDAGVTTEIALNDTRFSYNQISAVSEKENLWIHARSFRRSGKNGKGIEAVTVVRSADCNREAVDRETFVWRPLPKKRASNPRPLISF